MNFLTLEHFEKRFLTRVSCLELADQDEERVERAGMQYE